MTPNELSHPSEGVPTHFKHLLTYIFTEGCVYSEVLEETPTVLPSLAGKPFTPPTAPQIGSGRSLGMATRF